VNRLVSITLYSTLVITLFALGCGSENTTPGDPLVDIITGPDEGVDTNDPDVVEPPPPDGVEPLTFDMDACVVVSDENGESCSEELTLNLGTVPLGQSASGIVRLTNVGDVLGALTAITIDSDAFETVASLADVEASLPLDLPPQGSANVTITLLAGSPTGPLPADQVDITIESGDDTLTITIMLTGEIGGCETGWANCDDDLGNGCEVDVQTDTAHCGQCTAPCTVENGTASCVAGICTIDCDPGFEGNGCQTNTDDCADNNACINGTCVDGIASFTCTCNPGWDGEFCDNNPNNCPTPDPCDHGVCLDGINGFTCDCDTGWEGTLCDNNINECDPNPCVNGSCSDNIGGYSCSCDPGWFGPNCDEDINDCIGVTDCVNGVCVDEFSGWHCECEAEWGGQYCDIKLDTCSDNPCVNGTCSGEPGAISCDCDEGWIGMYCNLESGGGAPEGSILVTTLEDGFADDGQCTLREAIQSANTDTAVGGCTAGSGTDTVALSLTGVYTLSVTGSNEDNNQSGDLDISSDLTIWGLSPADSIVDGAQIDRVFHVHAAVTVEMIGLTIQGGKVVGGNGGAPAGGKAAGHGGAIYNQESNLTLTGCQLMGNEAIGGNGSNGQTPGGTGAGGGGAGLGGALFNNGGTITVNSGSFSCAFSANTATGGIGGKGSGNGGSFSSGNGGGGGGANGGKGAQGDAKGSGGGFGGGGGGGAGGSYKKAGGPGGFGGGGGGGGANAGGGNGANGGTGGYAGGKGGIGCCSASAGGGGAGGLGGAVFTMGGTLQITGCTFSGNAAVGGNQGANYYGGPAAVVGSGMGGAVFVHSGTADTSGNTYNANTADTDPDVHVF